MMRFEVVSCPQIAAMLSSRYHSRDEVIAFYKFYLIINLENPCDFDEIYDLLDRYLDKRQESIDNFVAIFSRVYIPALVADDDVDESDVETLAEDLYEVIYQPFEEELTTPRNKLLFSIEEVFFMTW